MPKTRFTSLDLRRAILDLQVQDIVGMRLSNLYDLNRKTYLLKFAKSDSKLYVVIESGIRVHGTKYSRERNEIPSIFSMKLRKFIRTKRIEKIEQYGMDRVFDMTFGSGEATYHLIVELYAAGNIILTDKDYNILCLLRSYTVGETTVAVGTVYPKEAVREIVPPSVESLREILQKNGEKNLKNALSNELEGFEPAVIEHCIILAGMTVKDKASSVGVDKLERLNDAFVDIIKYMESIAPHPGWIVSTKLAKKESKNNTNADNGDGVEEPKELILYDQFLPYLFQQYAQAGDLLTEFGSFNEAADEFYSKLESQKVETSQIQHETTVERKLEKVRQDHESRIRSLESQEQQFHRCAELIEQNIEAVEQCISIFRNIRSEHVDWNELAQQIKTEKENGNPIALMIHKLKLLENKVTLYLSDTFLVEDEDEYDKPAEIVDIDIGITAHANARAYYDKKKLAIEKNEKTRAASAAALQSAEAKAKSSLQDVKKLKSVTAIRKPFWFEKFHWFITSDNLIVVGGRDIAQNELLYKKYLQKGDWYFHCDIHGASSVVVKNPTGEPLPLNTIWQAGSFAMCHSNSWKNKQISETFYVADNQVSKTAPTGEYVSSGGFIIRGKKNYCTQNQLVMGFGLLFKVADESVLNHVDERKPKIIDMVATPDPTNKGWQPKRTKEEKQKDDQEIEIEVEDGDEIDEELALGMASLNLIRTTNTNDAAVDGEASADNEDENAAQGAEKAKADETEEIHDVGLKPKKVVHHQKQPQKKKEVPKEKKISKAKQKKIEKKYGWQDEEDKKACMLMLGHKFVEVGEESKVVTASKKELEAEEQRKQKEAYEEQKKERDNKRIRREKEEEEIRELMREEKIDLLSETDKKKIEENMALGQGINLSSLTGKPVPQDILLFALPYCAPYDAMKDFKFKAKILPGGSQKKGATARTIIQAFLHNPEATPQEKEIIKQVTDEDILLAMINTPKASMAGIQQAKNQSKSNKFNQKQQKLSESAELI